MNAAEHDERTIKMAIEAFKDHHLVMDDRQNGRWRIARKYEDGMLRNDMFTEIISLWGSRLFVGGDIDDCVFAYYSGPKDEKGEDFHLGKLAWIGRCKDVGYYVQQKATIGMTDGGKLTEKWEQEVALQQLREMLEDEQWCATDEDKEAINEAIELVDGGAEQYDVFNCLYRDLSDPYDLPSSLGMVTAPRVIYAWAACRRLCELIS